MRTFLKGYAILFGAVCALIAIGHIVMGPSIIPGSIPVNASMDSEDRFYATLFLGYGIAMIWSGLDLERRGQLFGWLLLVFFVAGISRLISWALVGPPIGFFIVLTAIELLSPPVLWLLYRQAFSQATGRS
ncbi:DUF4345 domain-containing protein [Henriciella aquimarina]|uniref:DUF4345 domain-containing protein n=1 Tax=Henriciella aquimarina TaxID=545261 RepID=UPI001301B661|nr:DUF4345 domain-containing protein [Henriciella aquimarina]